MGSEEKELAEILIEILDRLTITHKSITYDFNNAVFEDESKNKKMTSIININGSITISSN